MVVAATLMAMMDGIEAVADSGKVVSELEASISKKKGEDDFYLMKEYEKAMREETTSDCRKGCNACGIKNCEMWGKFHEYQNRL